MKKVNILVYFLTKISNYDRIKYGDFMKYELFFFKEGNRYLNLDELFSFFNYCPYITVDATNDEVEAKYYNKTIELEATFHITRVSKVPDIHRLDPKYLDLDIYLSIDPMMPIYKVGVIMDLVSDLCHKFDFFVYNILFENVSAFRKDLIMKSYEHIREVYKNKFPMEYASLNYVPVEKTNSILKYLFERKDLESYYHAEGLYFPVPYFIKSTSTGQIFTAVDFEEDKFFVFPPKCDLIFCKKDDRVEYIYFDELMSMVDKYCHDLPGFIHNTKVLDKPGIKKIKKIISKTKFTQINDAYTKIDLETIIDFK